MGFSSLLLNVFFQAQIVSKSMAGMGAEAPAPTGGLTALPRPLAAFKGSYFYGMRGEGREGKGKKEGREREKEGEEGKELGWA